MNILGQLEKLEVEWEPLASVLLFSSQYHQGAEKLAEALFSREMQRVGGSLAFPLIGFSLSVAGLVSSSQRINNQSEPLVMALAELGSAVGSPLTSHACQLEFVTSHPWPSWPQS